MIRLNSHIELLHKCKIREGLTLLTVFCLSIFTLSSQKLNEQYKQYIRTYADEAIRQMKQYDIPASITIAQGLIETGAGTSRLATEGNNHFGIKCHRAWQGKTMHANDERPNECFRKYDSARDSFRDHSLFLQQPRYKVLFTYSMTDYEAWARGLQLCGYATNKGYANMLIKAIEQYELYKLDRGQYPRWMSGKKAPGYTPSSGDPQTVLTHEGFFSYGLLYILANEGDSLESIAREMGMKLSKLADYNDMPEDFPLKKGDVIYLERKNSRATADYPDHVVRVGESMHSISQRYGVRLSKLYRMNQLSYEYVPEEGDVIRLR